MGSGGVRPAPAPLLPLPALLLLLLLLGAVGGAAGSAVLLPGQRLRPGDTITNGNGYLIMQADGDLAVCTTLSADGQSCGSEVLWSSSTQGNSGAYAEMQEMGVLAVFPQTCPEGPHDCRLWQSHTMAKAGCTPTDTNCAYVAIQKDGNVVLHKGASPASAGPVIWSTATKILPKGTKNVLWMIAE